MTGVCPREAAGYGQGWRMRLDVVRKQVGVGLIFLLVCFLGGSSCLSFVRSTHHRQDSVITQTVFPPWEAKSLYRQASGRAQVRSWVGR